MFMRRVMVFTSTRADYGLLKPVLRKIKENSALELILVVAGDHLISEKGNTVSEIKEDGFEVSEIVPFASASDSPEAIAKSIGLAVFDLAAAVRRREPDILLLLGDRFELMAPAACALVHRVPVAHIAGGESTEGVLDEQVRHALTKMAHLHFATTREYGWRIRRMGEETWRIHVVGNPGIENINKSDFMAPEEIKKTFGIDPEKPTLLVTFHPETLTGDQDTPWQMREVVSALAQFPDYQQVVTYPGTETGYRAVIEAWREHASGRANVILKQSLGSRGYLGLMRLVSAVAGNSSSGILEAPSFRIPTVNIGDRQKGRIRAGSVIDVECRKEEIIKGLEKALHDKKFRDGLQEIANPYDPYQDGNVSGRIVSVLESVPLGRKLLEKHLDFPSPEEAGLFLGGGMCHAG